MATNVWLRAPGLAALALAASAAAGPRDPLYQWTDAAGAVRYTTEIERIPLGQRGAAVVVADGHGVAPRATAPSAAQPAPPPDTTSPAPASPDEPAPAPVEAQPPPAAAAAPVDDAVAALDARIAELERSIAADEAALADYISDPERVKREHDSGDVAAIADRLPHLQDELRALRKQREAAAGATLNAP